jgi:hypothetical protein
MLGMESESQEEDRASGVESRRRERVREGGAWLFSGTSSILVHRVRREERRETGGDVWRVVPSGVSVREEGRKEGQT